MDFQALSEAQEKLHKAFMTWDVGLLRDLLEQGWVPYEGEEAPISAKLERMIRFDWLDGWLVLCGAYPQLRRDPRLLHMAFLCLSHNIAEDILHAGAFTITEDLGNTENAFLLVLKGMGKPGETATVAWRFNLESRVRASIDLLLKNGLAPTTYCPGDYIFLDPGIEGHTLWSRATFNMRWLSAVQFMPQSVEELVQHPRWEDAITQLREEAARPNEAIQAATAPVWKLWLSRFGVWWVNRPETMPLNELELLPSIEQASSELRAAIWASWNRPDEMGATLLHFCVDQMKDHRFRSVVKSLAEEYGEPASWEQEDAFGITPQAVWGQVLDVAEPLPLLALLEQVSRKELSGPETA